jgi:hypothetical protein
MNWKLKARIQNLISMLPSEMSYSLYYFVQRTLGGLKNFSPISRLESGFEIWTKIEEQGIDPKDKVFFEVGTGRAPLAPLAYWLMGAKKIYTIDLNPYIKKELLEDSFLYINENQQEIKSLFGSRLQNARFTKLIALATQPHFSLNEFFELCDIEYIAPGDAAKTPLEQGCIDFHTSYNVFEHIPEPVLSAILKEGNRIVKKSGLFIHKIDYSDHFAHSDTSISSINFLQFSDEKWSKIAGNRYMYMNRMRHDDFIELFNSVGQKIVFQEGRIDSQAEKLLNDSGIMLDKKFKDKPQKILNIIDSWWITELNA